MPSKTNIVAAVVILLLALVVLFQRTQLTNAQDQEAASTAAYKAIRSQISVRVADGIAEFKKAAPEIGVQDLVRDPQFETLSKDQQSFYRELAPKAKGFVAAARVKVVKRDSIHQEVRVPVLDTTATELRMRRGQVASFSDTTKAFKWHALVTVDVPVKLDLKYTYKPTFTTTFERDPKTHGTVVKLAVNDPDMQVSDIQSIVVPAEERDRTRVGKWLYKHRGVFRAVGAAVVFTAGVVGGVLLAH
jgi:hypothetical protein